MDFEVLFPPATARLSPREHSRSPSRSPTRGRITDDILADLSPDTTLESFTNASGALRASIEAASPSQRAFGIRAAVASKRIQEWLGELTGWHWPKEAGFEQPDTNRRRISVPGDKKEDIGTHKIDATRKTDNEVELDEYWGSLPARDVLRYELRIEEIEEDMEDLDVEEIKSQVLTTHLLPGTAHPSSPSSSIPQPIAYTRMEDFTAVVTATVLRALPNLSRLMALMDIWSVRLLILRQIPPLLSLLNEAELALKTGWQALRRKPRSMDGSEEEPVLSRENYEIMRGVLQDNVTLLGQKLDSMLDSLEGRQDTIPERWLDRMEAIEQDYGNWVVSGDRKVREGEWAREVAIRRSQKLTIVPEDDETHDQAIRQVEAIGENPTFAQPDDVGAILRNTQIDQLVKATEKRNSLRTIAVQPNQTELHALEQEKTILKKHASDDVPAQDSIKSTEVNTAQREPELKEIEPSVDILAKDHATEAPYLTSIPGPQSPFNTEEHIWLGSPLSPIADFVAFDGTRDYKPASIPLETLTPDGTPILNPTSELPGNLSNYDAASAELPPSDLMNEVNKTNALQKHDFTPSSMVIHEPTTTRDAKTRDKSTEGNPYMVLQFVSASEVANTLTDSHTAEKSVDSARQITEDRNKPQDTPRTQNKVPRFGHPLADIQSTSSMSPLDAELGFTPLISEEKINLARAENTVPTQIVSSSPSQKGLQDIKIDVPEERTDFAADQKPFSTRIAISSPKQEVSEDVSKDVPEEETDLAPEELPVLTQGASLFPRQEALQDFRRDVPEENADIAHEELPVSTQANSSSPRQEVLQYVDKGAPEAVALIIGTVSEDTQPNLSDTQSSVVQQEIPGKRHESIVAPTNLTLAFPNPEKSQMHSRQISTSSTISGYSASDPSPEICEAAEAYFSPVLSPTRQSHEPEGVTPTIGTFSGSSFGSDTMNEERPETPKALTRMIKLSSPLEHANSAKLDDFREPPDAKSEIALVEHRTVESVDPQVPNIERPRTAAQATSNNQTPGVINEAQSPIIDGDSYANFDDSPSFRRERIYFEADNNSPPNSPPQLPSISKRRPSNIQIDPYDVESLSSESPLTPSDSTFISGLDLSAIPETFAPVKVSDDQLQQQISEILESIPARIRLTSEPMSSFRSEIRPVKQRSLINLKSSIRSQSLATSRPQSRAATPSFTLAPAQSTQRRPRPQPGAPEIKLYHLSRSTGEAPIKLFVRLVGEHGERVMVRVGGGWADLGEYLKEYAAHHGRRPDPKGGKVEIQDLPPRTVSSSSVTTVRNNNGRSSPITRPGSSLERTNSSFTIRKTRRSVGADDSPQRGSVYGTGNSFSNNYRSPSTPLPSRPLPASRQVSTTNIETPPSATYTPPARSSSRLSWPDEDSSLGLAGPKSRKTEMSAENAAWVESMKEKVRIASAEKDREREREVQRRTSGGTGEFGEIGRVGATKRLFVKKGGPGGSGSGSGSGSLG